MKASNLPDKITGSIPEEPKDKTHLKEKRKSFFNWKVLTKPYLIAVNRRLQSAKHDSKGNKCWFSWKLRFWIKIAVHRILREPSLFSWLNDFQLMYVCRTPMNSFLLFSYENQVKMKLFFLFSLISISSSLKVENWVVDSWAIDENNENFPATVCESTDGGYEWKLVHSFQVNF